MPLWQIYHAPAAFSAAQKQALARDVTQMYTRIGLPAFYVVVQFHALAADSFFMSGAPVGETGRTGQTGKDAAGSSFVRVVVHHLAFQSAGAAAAHRQITEAVDGVLRPHVAARGLAWEYHVAESPPTLWKINGLVPPVLGDAALPAWVAQNRPVE